MQVAVGAEDQELDESFKFTVWRNREKGMANQESRTEHLSGVSRVNRDGWSVCQCQTMKTLLFGAFMCMHTMLHLKITTGHWPFSVQNCKMANHFPK